MWDVLGDVSEDLGPSRLASPIPVGRAGTLGAFFPTSVGFTVAVGTEEVAFVQLRLDGLEGAGANRREGELFLRRVTVVEVKSVGALVVSTLLTLPPEVGDGFPLNATEPLYCVGGMTPLAPPLKALPGSTPMELSLREHPAALLAQAMSSWGGLGHFEARGCVVLTEGGARRAELPGNQVVPLPRLRVGPPDGEGFLALGTLHVAHLLS